MPTLRFRRENDALFNINHNEIKRALSDANAPLVLKANELIESSLSISFDEINNEKLIEVKDVIKNIKNTLRELSKTRLKDGKPLNNAANVVKEFFGQYEQRLKSNLELLSNKAIEIHEELTSQLNIVEPEEPPLTEDNAYALGDTNNGTPVISTNIQSDQNTQEENTTIAIEDIEHKWAIEKFDRNILNIEILKDYFTDHSIKLALGAHLKEHGPNILDGVKYKKILD